MSRRSRAEAEAAMASASGDVIPAQAGTHSSARRPLPAVAAPEGAAPALLSTAYREIPLDQVHPSPLNPRKHLDNPALEALAQSIAEKGLLQPILVRPHPASAQAGEIIHGERRWRACKLAQADGRLPPDYRIPARVRACTDDELVILAGVENFDREDMEPLDEAELFALVRPRVTPNTGETREAALARLFHIGERTVFRRLALLRAVPEVQEALRAGALNITQAQAFSLGSPADQRKILKELPTRDWMKEPGRIRQAMTEQKIPIDRALFDPALYSGARIDDPESGQAWFADAGEFARLQELALRDKAAELGARWKWVEIVRGHFPYDKFVTDGVKKSDPEAGAVIQLDRMLRVEIHAPALTAAIAKARDRARAAGGKKTAAAEAAPARPLTEAQVRWVHAAKTRALRRAVIADPQAALALAVLGLLGARQVRGLQIGNDWAERTGAVASDARETAETLRLLATAALPLPPAMRPKPGKLPVFSGFDPDETVADHPMKEAAWFKALHQMNRDDLEELHRRLLAERVGSWAGYAQHNPPWFGDSMLAVTIAETVGAAGELRDLWQPDLEFFKAYGRERLEGLGVTVLGLSATEAARHKKLELAQLCAAQKPGFWQPGHFPEARFQPEDAAVKALATPRVPLDLTAAGRRVVGEPQAAE